MMFYYTFSTQHSLIQCITFTYIRKHVNVLYNLINSTLILTNVSEELAITVINVMFLVLNKTP